MTKYIIKIIVAYFSLFSNQLNASDSYLNISLSTSNNNLFVDIDTSYDIYGYQFQISNISLSNCVDPTGAGFYVDVGDNGNVLGVNLGSVIPSGQNTILSCSITGNQATESSGCCLVPDSIIIANGQSSGGYTPQVSGSEIAIGDCLYLDCFDEFGGLAIIDDCGECTGGSTGLENNYLEDCAGECNGNAILDCMSICNGTAEIDGCGECVGGNTGLVACGNDCSGNIGGLATYNECETCICNGEIAQNGYTCVNSELECIQGCDGNWKNDGTELLNDECGVCGGDNTACLDCAGLPNGSSELDCLGVCGDPNGENFAIEDLCGNCLGSCLSPPIIDCDCEILNLSGIDTVICTGDCSPDSYTDPCFVWNTETWVDIDGGTIFYDDGEELNDINGNGLADIGCYDCGGNTLGDDNYDNGNIFREYSCMNPEVYNTQFYCSALINNNIGNDGSCLSNSHKEFVSQFSLFSAYPNPFNPITTINYSVESAGNLTIDIYNILGEHIYTLIDGYHVPGNLYQVSWNSEKQSNKHISSGIYFIKAKHGNSILIQELTLLK